jgi:hypothetical protein
VLNTTSFGAPNVGYRINNGKLIIQSAFQTVSMQSFVEASGDATVSLEGSFLRNGMSQFHGAARSDAAEISILGTYSENIYRVSSDVFLSGSTPRMISRIDVLIPSTPLNLQAEAVSDSQIDLSWEPSTDNIGVAGYHIYRNGVKIAGISETTFTDTGLMRGTLYDYFIRAYDAAGNESISSDTLSLSTLSVGVVPSNNASDDLKVHPNPAKGTVYVSLPNMGPVGSGVSFELYAVTGTLVWSEKIPPTDRQTEFRFDISELMDGMYIYQLKSTRMTQTGKLYISK